MVAPLVGASLIQGGAGILGGLASFFGGGKQRKRQGQLFQRGLGMLGEQPFDPEELSQQAFRSAQPELEAFGGRLNQRFGLDSGVAQGEALKNLFQTKLGIRSRFGAQAATAGFNRDASLLGLLAQINRG